MRTPAVPTYVLVLLLAGCLIIVLMSTRWCFAQKESGRVTLVQKLDSLARSNLTSLNFERNFNTFTWDTRANYERMFEDVSIRLNERFSSTLIRTSEKFVKDNQELGFLIGKKISSKTNLLLDGSSLIFSDNRNIGINKASIHSVLTGFSFQPSARAEISPRIGIKFDNQIGQNDKGVSYIVTSKIGELDFDGYKTNVFGKFNQDQLNPRKAESHQAFITVDKTFPDAVGTKNNLRVQFLRNRRDFYFPGDSTLIQEFGVTNNIESRVENIVELNNELSYGAGENLIFTVNSNLYNRSISKNIRYKTAGLFGGNLFDTDISEFKLDGSLQATYTNGENFRGGLQFAYGERDEKHAPRSRQGVSTSVIESERRKDNSARRSSIAGDALVRFSQADVLSITASSNLLRYDTPSTENFDDRDELLMTLNIAEQHAFNPQFLFRLSAGVSLNHIVYLDRRNSANNNWNRVFRLSPRIEYFPSSSFKTVNTFEVLANYTVYDFEEQVFSVRSFSFRQFSLIDSTSYRFSRNLTVGFFSHMKLYERGELRWKEFSERPVNFFEDKTFSAHLQYTPEEKILFAVGFSYFSQTRFSYVGADRVFDSVLKNYGPTCSFEWVMNGASRFLLSGWYEIQQQTSGELHPISNLSMKLVVGL